MSWLPSNDKEPDSGGGNYLKIGEGETINVRLLGAKDNGFIAGYEVWDETEGKPVPHRYKDKTEIPAGDYRDPPRFFWAVIVLHEGRAKIWQISQRGIRDQIRLYADNEKYGDPRGYDVVVSRNGSGLETTYTVMAEPPSELSDEDKVTARKAIEEVNVEALFTNDDPFAGEANAQGEPF